MGFCEAPGDHSDCERCYINKSEVDFPGLLNVNLLKDPVHSMFKIPNE